MKIIPRWYSFSRQFVYGGFGEIMVIPKTQNPTLCGIMANLKKNTLEILIPKMVTKWVVNPKKTGKH